MRCWALSRLELFFLISLGALHLGFAPFSQAEDFTGLDISHPALAQGALNALREGGLEAYVDHWAKDSQTLQDFRSWCKEQRREHGNIEYELPIHENNLEAIEAINEVNAGLGLDCYKLKAKITNAAFYDPNKPTPDRRFLYRMANLSRTILVPTIGYWIFYKLMGDQSLTEAIHKMGGEFLQSNVKAAIEAQFAFLSALWSVPFGQKEFSGALTKLFRPVGSTLSWLNKIFKKTNYTVRASQLWISAVNLLMYPFLMGAAFEAGNHIFGPKSSDSLSVGGAFESGLSTIWDQLGTSLAFNFTFMFFQEGASKARNRSQLSELARFLLETGPCFLFNTFRGVSAMLPQYKWHMFWSQVVVGSVFSVIMLAKLRGVSAKATELGQKAAQADVRLSPEEISALESGMILADERVDAKTESPSCEAKATGWFGKVRENIKGRFDELSLWVFNTLRTTSSALKPL